MNDMTKTISIKMVTLKFGWKRHAVNRRGKKMVYSKWHKSPKLMAKYTLESIRDLPAQHGIGLEDELVKNFYESITN